MAVSNGFESENKERLFDYFKWHLDDLDSEGEKNAMAIMAFLEDLGRSTEEGSQNLGLEDYVLMRPKLAKQFGNYMNGFIGGAFVVGKYMQFTDYPFTPNAVDFGLELEF